MNITDALTEALQGKRILLINEGAKFLDKVIKVDEFQFAFINSPLDEPLIVLGTNDEGQHVQYPMHIYANFEILYNDDTTNGDN